MVGFQITLCCSLPGVQFVGAQRDKIAREKIEERGEAREGGRTFL